MKQDCIWVINPRNKIQKWHFTAEAYGGEGYKLLTWGTSNGQALTTVMADDVLELVSEPDEPKLDFEVVGTVRYLNVRGLDNIPFTAPCLVQGRYKTTGLVLVILGFFIGYTRSGADVMGPITHKVREQEFLV